jgi:acetyltransferase-like isoleucine patch superfamily enzyme
MLISNPYKRAKYLKQHNIFFEIGNNCSIMNRIIPLYSKLIKLGNNVHLASNVNFITHDVAHAMLNNLDFDNKQTRDTPIFEEKIGCIEIKNNVFVGANCSILYNVQIGNNVIIGSGSVVTKDIPDNSIVAGIPAKVIGNFGDFVHKRIKTNYPKELKPINQIISNELVEFCWNDFYKQRR